MLESVTLELKPQQLPNEFFRVQLEHGNFQLVCLISCSRCVVAMMLLMFFFEGAASRRSGGLSRRGNVHCFAMLVQVRVLSMALLLRAHGTRFTLHTIFG